MFDCSKTNLNVNVLYFKKVIVTTVYHFITSDFKIVDILVYCCRDAHRPKNTIYYSGGSKFYTVLECQAPDGILS